MNEMRHTMNIEACLCEAPRGPAVAWVATNTNTHETIDARNPGIAKHYARKAGWRDSDYIVHPKGTAPTVAPPAQDENGWIVSCVKTGKWWTASSRECAVAIAQRKGLVDYEVYPKE